MSQGVAHEQARRLAAQGLVEEAERQYLLILERVPDDIEALNFVALCAFRAGATGRGFALMRQALAADDANPETWKNLGTAHLAHGELDQAEDCLKRALELAPDFFIARLHYARAQERRGRGRRALMEYFRSIFTAQRVGHWRQLEAVPAGLREAVLHGMRVVNQGRQALFYGLLEPLRQRYGAGELYRVEQALAGYLGDAQVENPDPAQKPTFLYVPGLEPRAFPPLHEFAWIPELEAQFEAIRAELEGVAETEGGFVPVHAGLSARQLGGYLESTSGQARWDGYYFYRHGDAHEDHCRRCPATWAALQRLPLARIRDHAPESMFSALAPGTRIKPHRGITNLRLVVHLPVVVPAECALKVGEQVHVWEEGRCVIFEDTFEHEAWNRSARMRYVLITDIWNPRLSEAERAALTDLIAGIGDFNRECGIDETPA